MAQTPMEFAAQTITETASTLLRMRTALELLSLAQSPTAPELVHWLKQLLPPDDLAFGAEFEFGVSLAAHRRWLTWQLSAEPLQLIVRLSDYLAQLGISDREMDRLSQAGERLQPPRLGSWIQITQETFDLGWYFPGDIPLHQALVWVGCQSAGERLAAWADQAGIQTAIYLGQSLGQNSPFTEIRVPLPGGDVEQQLAAGLALFEALGLEGPVEMALAALLHYLPAHTGLMTSIWFSPTGVSKVGVLAPNPSTLLLLQLCHLAGLEQPDTIAAFQGTLGVDSPTHVECQQFTDGFYLELHYQLSPQPKF